MNTAKLFIPFILILILTDTSFSQVSAKDNPVCTADFARLFVEQQVAESKMVEETDKRVKILIRSADFLWTLDEATARKYFGEAFDTADARFKEKGFESKTDKGLLIIHPDYRFQVISAIAKKDVEWARKLWEKVLKEYEERAKDETKLMDKDREISELMMIARENAQDNPQLTLQIARRLMRYPLTYNWYYTLYTIAAKNQSLADQIYSELLQNYANAEIFRLAYLAAYPFGRDRIIGIEKNNFISNVPANFVRRPNLQAQFINTFLRRVFALTPENIEVSIYSQIADPAIAVTALNDLEPIVLESFPDYLETLQRAKSHANSLMTGEMLESVRQKERWSAELAVSFEERLKRLEELSTTGKLRDYDIVSLIFNLKKEEHFKEAESWLIKISDSKVREDATNLFYFNRAMFAVKENRLDDAKKFVNRIAEFKHRAGMYFEIAEAELKTTKNTFQMLEILDEPYKLAQKSDDSVEKAQVFFGIASQLAAVDISRALDSVSNAIKVTNRLENPDIFTEFSYQAIITKQGQFYVGFSTVGFNMEETFKKLGEKDFSLTLGQAQSFSDKYFRTIAVIATVKDCAKNKPAKTKTKAKT